MTSPSVLETSFEDGTSCIGCTSAIRASSHSSVQGWSCTAPGQHRVSARPQTSVFFCSARLKNFYSHLSKRLVRTIFRIGMCRSAPQQVPSDRKKAVNFGSVLHILDGTTPLGIVEHRRNVCRQDGLLSQPKAVLPSEGLHCKWHHGALDGACGLLRVLSTAGEAGLQCQRV